MIAFVEAALSLAFFVWITGQLVWRFIWLPREARHAHAIDALFRLDAIPRPRVGSTCQLCGNALPSLVYNRHPNLGWWRYKLHRAFCNLRSRPRAAQLARLRAHDRYLDNTVDPFL